MKDSESKNRDNESSSPLTMTYTVTDTANTKSKASYFGNLTKHSKQPTEPLDFSLSPSDGSIPQNKNMVGQLLTFAIVTLLRKTAEIIKKLFWVTQGYRKNFFKNNKTSSNYLRELV